MPSISLNFEVHQPMRLKHLPNNTEGLKDNQLIDHYINNGLNKFVFDRAAKKCYWPTTSILLELVDTFKGQKREFKFGFNFSGLWIEQCEKWQPDLLDQIKQLIKSKRVEVLGSTYFHSLVSLFDSHEEFIEQVKMQNRLIKDLFGVRPKIFMNTEMIFNNLIARTVEKLGYKAIFTEGIERVLGWRSPNYVYVRGPAKQNDIPLNKRIRVLLRNYRLSDDVGYRFSSKWWNEWPLTAEKYSAWLSATPGQVINLFIDFETFGEHQPESSGIFFFLKALPWKIFEWQNLEFLKPSEIIKKYEPTGEFDVPGWNAISWADMERDTSAWLGNSMQQMAFEELKKSEKVVKQNGKNLLKLWRLLTQSDHLYYMCTKWWNDGDVHKYFSPFSTPHDGFISIVSALTDIKLRITRKMVMKKIRKRKTKRKKTIKIKRRIKPRKKVLKPKLLSEKSVTPKLKREISDIESILKEKVIYPDVTINPESLNSISKELKKRVK